MLQRKMLTLCRDRGVQFYASALAAIGRHAPNILTDTDLQIFEKMLAASDLYSEYRESVLARIASGGVPIEGGTARALHELRELDKKARAVVRSAERRGGPVSVSTSSHLRLRVYKQKKKKKL